MRWLLCVILAVRITVVQGATTSSDSSEFPFEHREGLLWVEVNIPECEKPLNFLLDTGAGVSSINLRTAKRMGFKLGHEVAVRGVDTKLVGYWQQGISAKVGDVTLPAEYLAVDLDKLSRSCQRSVDGLIGADFFRGRVVQIDFTAQRIRLLEPEDLVKSDNALPLDMRACGMRVPISVNDHVRQWVRLDTGCATALQWVTSKVPEEKGSNRNMRPFHLVSYPERALIRYGCRLWVVHPLLHSSLCTFGAAEIQSGSNALDCQLVSFRRRAVIANLSGSLLRRFDKSATVQPRRFNSSAKIRSARACAASRRSAPL